MMSPVLILLVILFASLTTRSGFAFGALGHQVIASLAEGMLTPKAKEQVTSMLRVAGEPATLAAVSTWADEIRMLRPETRGWHYVTLQISEPGYDSSKAEGGNVVKALNRQIATLANPGANRYAREEALKWVVHLVADLHQPLHVGEDRDKGGNLTFVKVNRRSYNLHAVWDHVLLDRLRLPADSLRTMLELRIAADPGFILRHAPLYKSAGTVEKWTNETHGKTASCYLLRGKPMRKGIKIQLDKEYVNDATIAVLHQLQIAGVRLAYVLNRALDPQGKTVVAPKPPGARNIDTTDFFARADTIKEFESAPKSQAPKSVGGTFAWSANSQVYHYASCRDVARIKRKNLRHGQQAPVRGHLHSRCPIP